MEIWAEIMKGIFTGNNLAIAGAALATILPGIGSARGNLTEA